MALSKLHCLLAHNRGKGQFRAEGNTIYVYDVIVASEADAAWFGGVAAETFVQQLKGMAGDVAVRVNSPGGDVFAGRAMAAAIREHAGQVTVHVDGYAASAASFLTSAADRTVMAAGSMIMIHKAWTLALGNADDFMATAALLDKIDGSIAETYAATAKRRGVDPADFPALMAAETWFTPAEAIAAGLADAVAEDGPKARLDWDLSAYEHAPTAARAAASAADVQVVESAPEHVPKPDPGVNDQQRLRNDLRIRFPRAA